MGRVFGSGLVGTDASELSMGVGPQQLFLPSQASFQPNSELFGQLSKPRFETIFATSELIKLIL